MTRNIVINQKSIDDKSDAYVIAELGHNHGGELDKAVHLVQLAAKSGANAVKLQKRENKVLFTKAMYDAPYSGRNSFGTTYGEHREALEFGRLEYQELSKLSRELSVDLFATAFDCPSVDFLMDVGVPAIKIASGDLTNTPLLRYAASTSVPLIVSTGGADMADVRRAADVIGAINSRFALLQCTTVYPASVDSLNLSVIQTYRQEFPDVVIGLSSHDMGSESSVIAYTLGARIIEKHFTIDKTLPGSDHHFSMETGELRELVDRLQRTRLSLGNSEKRELSVETTALYKMGKKLVAARDLGIGHVITSEDIAIKSPGDGLRPYLLEEVLGRALMVPLEADDAIQFYHLC